MRTLILYYYMQCRYILHCYSGSLVHLVPAVSIVRYVWDLWDLWIPCCNKCCYLTINTELIQISFYVRLAKVSKFLQLSEICMPVPEKSLQIVQSYAPYQCSRLMYICNTFGTCMAMIPFNCHNINRREEVWCI